MRVARGRAAGAYRVFVCLVRCLVSWRTTCPEAFPAESDSLTRARPTRSPEPGRLWELARRGDSSSTSRELGTAWRTPNTRNG